jgi:hypothetical protein
MSAAFDWTALEKHLVTHCRKAITLFTRTKGATKKDPLAFFAIDSNPYYGEFLPSFDTLANARACMRAEQTRRLEHRAWMKLEGKNAWRETYDCAYNSAAPMFNPDVSEFSHHMFHEAEYKALDTLARSKQYAKLNANAGKDGWIEGHVRVVLARVCDALVDKKAFAKLPLAEPFGVGYQYHDERMVVCRVIV